VVQVTVATAAGYKVGQTVWRCFVNLDNGSDPRAKTVAEAEAPEGSLEDAKRFGSRILAGLTNPAESGADGNRQQYWAIVELGTYVDTSFTYRSEHVTDGSWERDDDALKWFAYLGDDGTTEWVEG
jgi:hypothetical protein